MTQRYADPIDKTRLKSSNVTGKEKDKILSKQFIIVFTENNSSLNIELISTLFALLLLSLNL